MAFTEITEIPIHILQFNIVPLKILVKNATLMFKL